MRRGLSEKQETFCVEYLKAGNASAAYRKAGYGKGASAKSVNESASRMLKSVKVRSRIAALRAKVEQKSVVTYEGHVSKMAEIRDAAIADKQFSAATSAEAYRGKAAGLYDQHRPDEPPDGEVVGDGITLDQARRVAFLLTAGLRGMATAIAQAPALTQPIQLPAPKKPKT